MRLWLRIAAVIATLFAVGHTIGRPWVVGKDAATRAVVDAMRSVHFDDAGPTRSYWDFYQGFGLMLCALLAVQAVLLWQCAALSGSGRIALRPLLLTLLLGYAAGAVIAVLYIFPVPAIFSGAVAVCIGVAILRPAPTVPAATS